jgi:sterol desaturase/sphingolipid hydroxylase (fatty acid hydroxylase superfamily)
MSPHALAAVAGVFTWSFLEYVIHRWLGHDRRFRGNPFGKEHLRHHVEGNYFAPTRTKLAVAAIATAITGVPALLLGGTVGLAWVAGFIVAYGSYEVLHRREHTHAGIGAYGRWARRHHFHHHFVDGRANHGVTTPLWDLVFGTYQRPALIPVPPRLCMAWLLDERGAIRAEHAGRFVLREPRRAVT